MNENLPNSQGNNLSDGLSTTPQSSAGVPTATPSPVVAEPDTNLLDQVAQDLDTPGQENDDSKPVTNQKADEIPENVLNFDNGLNLIPRKSKAEEEVETKKTSFNLGAAVLILLLVVVSIGIVGFNILTKLELNREKAKLVALEDDVRRDSSKITSNNEILQRINLYNEINETTSSSKEVFQYWNDIAEGVATINSVELVDGLRFTVSGKTKNLLDISKLWHLLSIDEGVVNVNLVSLSNGEQEVQFSFEGDLNPEVFERTINSDDIQ